MKSAGVKAKQRPCKGQGATIRGAQAEVEKCSPPHFLSLFSQKFGEREDRRRRRRRARERERESGGENWRTESFIWNFE